MMPTFKKKNFNQILYSRQITFMTRKNRRCKIGLNAILNRIAILKGVIPLSILNEGYDNFKIKTKNCVCERFLGYCVVTLQPGLG